MMMPRVWRRCWKEEASTSRRYLTSHGSNDRWTTPVPVLMSVRGLTLMPMQGIRRKFHQISSTFFLFRRPLSTSAATIMDMSSLSLNETNHKDDVDVRNIDADPVKPNGSQLRSFRRYKNEILYDATVQEKIVQGVKEYKKRYNVAWIPMRFSVPDEINQAVSLPTTSSCTSMNILTDQESEEKWPTELCGFPLGEYARYVRRIHRDHELPVEFEKALDAIGFGWQLSDYNFERIKLPALKTYKALYGDLLVSMSGSFTVPKGSVGVGTGKEGEINTHPWPRETWGLNLPAVVNEFRSQRHTLSAKRVEQLNDLGFVWEADEYWAQSVLLPAMQVYKKMHGHLRVPLKFIVPHGDSSWPTETWNLRLGRVVTRLRSNPEQYSAIKKHIQDLGFHWDNIYDQRARTVLLPAFQTFRELHGHTQIPVGFVVPTGDPRWPTPTWSLKLGRRYVDLKSQGCYAVIHEDLKKLGYSVHSNQLHSSLASHASLLLFSLRTFMQVHPSSTVPRSFVVPSEEPWPQETWGFRLGEWVDVYRRHGFPHEVDQEIENMGFIACFRKLYARKVVLPTLQAYHSLHGNVNVPKSFIVPSSSSSDCDSVWPVEAHGFRLGRYVARIRLKGCHPSIQKELCDLGFKWDMAAPESLSRSLVLPALQTYHRLYGNLRVPQSFVVPHNDPNWPKDTWKVRLGRMVSNIRHRNDHKCIQNELDAMGFDWRIRRRREDDFT